MEENVLIRSSLSPKAKKVFLAIIFASLLLSIIYFFLMFNYEDNTILCIVAATSLFIAIVTFIIYKCYLKINLVIKEKKVIGRTLFGKRLYLPIHQITAYSTRSLFSKIVISTPSGNTSFVFVGNYIKIAKVLADLINQRQKNTESFNPQTTARETTQPTQLSNLDELKKLKELLDMGAITQEEFDVKKKQLLEH